VCALNLTRTKNFAAEENRLRELFVGYFFARYSFFTVLLEGKWARGSVFGAEQRDGEGSGPIFEDIRISELDMLMRCHW
jgi:hypothetical protein